MTDAYPQPQSPTKNKQMVVMIHPRSDEFETRGLDDINVELDHWKTVAHEIKRERLVSEGLRKDVSMLRGQLKRAEDVRDKQQAHIDSLDKVRIEQQSHIGILVQENTALKTELSIVIEDKEMIHKELLNASDYIGTIEERCYEVNLRSLDLLQKYREFELWYDNTWVPETDVLKSYIIDLKSRVPNFIAAKGDPVDKALAEYINALPNRTQMKIMFLRRSPGIYEFGTLRVAIEVKREKILVKVGGGQNGIDEFL